LAKNQTKSRAAKDTINAGRGSGGVQNMAGNIKIDTCSLCNEELCQLILQITEGGHRSKSFLRRMVILWDSLNAGQTNKVIQFASRAKDPAFARLMAAISDSIRSGDLATASIIVFLAAGFAYQNTLDYYLDLTSYLDRFRSARKEPRISADRRG
jgi:hypothetical protein